MGLRAARGDARSDVSGELRGPSPAATPVAHDWCACRDWTDDLRPDGAGGVPAVHAGVGNHAQLLRRHRGPHGVACAPGGVTTQSIEESVFRLWALGFRLWAFGLAPKTVTQDGPQSRHELRSPRGRKRSCRLRPVVWRRRDCDWYGESGQSLTRELEEPRSVAASTPSRVFDDELLQTTRGVARWSS